MSFMALAGAIGAGATALGATAGVASAIGAVGAGAIGGAGLGALSSAITGGDVGKGALFGALGGGLTGGLGSAIGGMGGAAGAGTGSAAGSASAPVAAAGQAAGNLANTAGSTLSTATSAEPLMGSMFGSPSMGVSAPIAGATPMASPIAGSAGGFSPIAGVPSPYTPPTLPMSPVNAGTAPMTSAIDTAGIARGAYSLPTGLENLGTLSNADLVKAQLANSLFGQYPGMTIGAGSMLGSYLGNDNKTTQANAPYDTGGGMLSWYKFDPRKFRSQPSGYTGYLYGNPDFQQPKRFADGGIASLNPNSDMMQSGPAQVDFMGEDAYPMSQQKLHFYSTPTQMPTSAQQAMASYEPSTNPLTGEPIAHFDEGGIAQIPVGGKLLRGPGDGVSDSIPANIEGRQEARLADGEYVIPARAVSELGNGSTDAGAKKLSAMVDRIQKGRRKSMTRKNIAVDSKAHKAMPV